jgi:nitrite reductase/ring-hydroxylating ferredoxin subunit
MECLDSTFGIEICSLEKIPDGGGHIVQLSPEAKNLGLLVLRSGDSCYGYINQCPHFGVPLAATDSQLIFSAHRWVKCNVHYARFRWEDGLCEAGECEGEFLKKVPLKIQNGKVIFSGGAVPSNVFWQVGGKLE